jgi:peroxiredoxin
MKSALSLLLVLAPSLALAGSTEKTSPIGKRIDDFKLRDFRGAERSLHEFAKAKLVVVAFTGTECPVAKLYGPRLVELAGEYGPKGVAFVGINANFQDSVTAIGQFAKASGITFPILKDVGNAIADRFGAVRTPEVFVLDGERVVRYWGRIDDQYGVGYTRPKPERRDLAEALDQLLAGKPVNNAVTTAPGCFIGRVKKEPKTGELTYAKHIAPIFQKRCTECHHEGEIAPFSLTSYEEAIGWTDTIREVVEAGRMPPWHANPKYGKFSNDSHLPAAEKQLVLDWINNGAPEGDPKDLPKPVEHVKGWRIPKPDLVLTMPKAFAVPATGEVPYQFFVIDPGFKEDKWVKAAEVQAGCRAVVHHILVLIVEPDGSHMKRDFGDNWLAAMAPGTRPMMLPEGMAKRVPAGAKLLFQLHYTPNGAPQMDQSRVGLVFADPKDVKKEVKVEATAQHDFVIPPHDGNHRVEAWRTIDQDTVLLELMPHTHLRGKSFQYEAIYPDGKHEILLDLPTYDFNWQNTYVLETPKQLPKGTQLHCVAYYDNSKKNKSNPNPDEEVRWGDQTWEEMMIGYYDVVPVNQDLQKNPLPVAKAKSKTAPSLTPELKRLAGHALDSAETFDAFAAAVHRALPQVDRVCFSTYAGGSLKVERCSYPGEVARHIATAGFEGRSKLFALGHYAVLGLFVYNKDLSKAQGVDLTMIGQTLNSSVHVPVARDGDPATVNFWSKQKDAFSKDTQDALRSLADAVTSHASQSSVRR